VGKTRKPSKIRSGAENQTRRSQGKTGHQLQGQALAIAFNPKNVIDPLNALDNDEVFIELIDELSPGVLKINGPFLYVVMPMRLS
jgi:DNA polymerase sliding clamp subunit (PCNA homolog)